MSANTKGAIGFGCMILGIVLLIYYIATVHAQEPIDVVPGAVAGAIAATTDGDSIEVACKWDWLDGKSVVICQTNVNVYARRNGKLEIGSCCSIDRDERRRRGHNYDSSRWIGTATMVGVAKP